MAPVYGVPNAAPPNWPNAGATPTPFAAQPTLTVAGPVAQPFPADAARPAPPPGPPAPPSAARQPTAAESQGTAARPLRPGLPPAFDPANYVVVYVGPPPGSLPGQHCIHPGAILPVVYSRQPLEVPPTSFVSVLVIRRPLAHGLHLRLPMQHTLEVSCTPVRPLLRIPATVILGPEHPARPDPIPHKASRWCHLARTPCQPPASSNKPRMMERPHLLLKALILPIFLPANHIHHHRLFPALMGLSNH
jgi:hypothetical protein